MTTIIETTKYIYKVASVDIIAKGYLYYDTAAIDEGEHCVHVAEEDIINPPAQVLIVGILLK